jgi:hypothetical protein
MLLTFETAEAKPETYLRNRVNADSLDYDGCKGPLAETPERLGPSLVRPSASLKQPESKGHQRNELRFKRRSDWHDAGASHWYSIGFKVTGSEGSQLPCCDSERWVIAQWKYEKLGPNLSPFLAQRFDDSVLHVTVEDGFCRCMIAKGSESSGKAVASQAGGLKTVAPLTCVNTNENEPPGPCVPKNMKLSAYAQSDLESLPDPTKDWVRMTYRVKAGGARESIFEVYADGRFIVRAEGAYEENVSFPNNVKFKFGHYRDKVSTSADMLIDEVCVSQDLGTCAPSVRPPE